VRLVLVQLIEASRTGAVEQPPGEPQESADDENAPSDDPRTTPDDPRRRHGKQPGRTRNVETHMNERASTSSQGVESRMGRAV
jgi:hypothetical protein